MKMPWKTCENPVNIPWIYSQDFHGFSFHTRTLTSVSTLIKSFLQTWINQYIQHPLKRSLEPPESISALRSMVGNTKRVLQCFGFAQIVRTLCDSRVRFFKNYIQWNPVSRVTKGLFKEQVNHVNLTLSL